MSVPKRLVELAQQVRHPAVTQAGVTLTREGRWALLLQVRKGTALPLTDLGPSVGDYAIVFEEEPDALPIARPAYPDRGE